MAGRSDDEIVGKGESRSILDVIREDRYVLIMAVAVLIFIATASIAFMSDTGLAVSGVTARPFSSTVVLSWHASKSSSALGYDVYRSAEQGVLGTKLNSATLKALTYRDNGVDPGTYYYAVRTVTSTGDDGSTQQVQAVVAQAGPSGLSLSINKGAAYTDTVDVELQLSAMDAKQCRLKNDEDPKWGAWEAYATQKSWKLSPGLDGERIFAYQCRGAVESSMVFTSVTLDTTAPAVRYLTTSSAGTIQVGIRVKDALSDSVSCTIIDGASEESVEIPLSAGGQGSYDYKKTVPSGQHAISLSCTDQAGNVNGNPAQTVLVP